MKDEGHWDEFSRGWGLVCACLLGIAFGAAPFGTIYSLSSFVRPLRAEFGWTEQQIQTIPMIVLASLTPVSLVVGWAADRVDLRRLIIASQVGAALCIGALGALTTNLTTFYLLYFLLPIVGAGTLAITFTKLLSRSFFQHRGLAVGIALTGTGLCGIVTPSYASWLIANFGWRRAYEGLALLPLCVALPATLALLRGRPVAPGRAGGAQARLEHEGDSLAAALSSWRYWAIALAIGLCSVASTGLITNMVPIFMDKGLSVANAARMASVFGLTVILGRIVFGWSLDRFWAPAVGAVAFALNALALFPLAQNGLGGSVILFLTAVIGITTGAELDLATYLCSRYFGLRHFASIYAGVFVSLALGGALAARAYGRGHDLTGSYNAALIWSAVALLISAGLLLTLGPYRFAAALPDQQPRRNSAERPTASELAERA